MAIKRHLTISRRDGNTLGIESEYPDECPICNRNVDPKAMTGVHTDGDNANDPKEFQVSFCCTREECASLFIGIYRKSTHDGGYELVGLRPRYANVPDVEETILKLSPGFISIREQALSAETYGLDQIVGIGLRKAFEFLIKDFAIYLAPDKTEEIKAMWLKAVIDKYVEDPNLKAVSNRVTWLGNDETHYERLWTNKDLTDLKRLIHISLNWIDTVIASTQYIDEMPEPSKKAKAQ